MSIDGPLLPTPLVFSDRFLDEGVPRDDAPDPFRGERLVRMLDSIEALGLELPIVEPRPATDPEIAMVHTPEYIERIRGYSDGTILRDDDFRWVSAETAIASNTYELAALGCGAVITAVDAVLEGRAKNAIVMARPGDHHAYPARGEGFCIFNHTAVGARYAQGEHGLRKVMIVDWDVHHGNGTQAIFTSDPAVFTLSIHSFGSIYPRKGAATERGTGLGQGTVLNIPMDPGTEDKEFLRSFERGLRGVRFQPELVLVVAGFDAHRADPLGDLRLSERAFPELTRMTLEYADRVCGGMLVSVLGGGYNLETIGPFGGGARAGTVYLAAGVIPGGRSDSLAEGVILWRME